MLELVIGNYNYSSWSLRVWLHLRASDIPFKVTRIPLLTDTWQAEIGRYTPAGRVPVLIDGDLTVWDSMAIIEHIIERFPEAIGWPPDPRDRALARSICAEMHAGFLAIRGELPQNIRQRKTLSPSRLSRDCQQQLQRIDEIWSECRAAHADAGPWLFGELSIADIMYVPVALRLVTYGISMSAKAEEFISAVQQLDALQEWAEAAADEKEEMIFFDDLRPVAETPHTPG